VAPWEVHGCRSDGRIGVLQRGRNSSVPNVGIGTRSAILAESMSRLAAETVTTGIKLLGFKDLDQLTIEDSVKHSFFIYPDESVSD
jgi:hypothetical protein